MNLKQYSESQPVQGKAGITDWKLCFVITWNYLEPAAAFQPADPSMDKHNWYTQNNITATRVLVAIPSIYRHLLSNIVNTTVLTAIFQEIPSNGFSETFKECQSSIFTVWMHFLLLNQHFQNIAANGYSQWHITT